MNVAMISYWHVHAREYAEKLASMPDVKITAVWDDNLEAGKKWAEELGCRFTESFDDILEDKSIDGIAMTAKTVLHGEMLLKAAKAGKHIFTEKVLAMTTEECEAIAAAVKENNVVFTISYPHQCRADLQFAKQMLDSGALGQVTYARLRNAHDGSSSGWLPDTFYDVAQCGGGAMLDLGAHGMYLMNWLFGKPKSVISCFTQVTGKPVEDNAVSVMEFQNGTIGVAETGFVCKGNPFTLELSGTKGCLLVRDGVTYANEETEYEWVAVETLPEALLMPLEQWVGAIEGKTENHFGVENAVTLTTMMEGAYEAWKTGSKYLF